MGSSKSLMNRCLSIHRQVFIMYANQALDYLVPADWQAAPAIAMVYLNKVLKEKPHFLFILSTGLGKSRVTMVLL
jgi:hypothetical protein